jgi:AraC-like DNA-binding protein
MATPPPYETRHGRGTNMPMHRHREPYAALILAGSYIENSVDGQLPCRPGTLVLHPAYHAHGDSFGRLGARVLNFVPPPGWWSTRSEVFSVPNLREAVQIVRHAPARLDELKCLGSSHETLDPRDWQKEFVKALGESEEPIGHIARRLGVSAAHASRELRASFGMSPQGLRRELRWRRALELLQTPLPLRDVAALAEFADQSHLTRIVRAHSGLTPTALRLHIKCVQDAAAQALVK